VPDLDTELLKSIHRTMLRIRRFEEGAVGLFMVGAEIATQVMERALYHLEKPVKRVCGRNVAAPFAPVMENFVIPGAADVVKAVKELL